MHDMEEWENPQKAAIFENNSVFTEIMCEHVSEEGGILITGWLNIFSNFL